MLNELGRRNAEVGYVKTDAGLEVDFLARHPGAGQRLLLVLDRDAIAQVKAPDVPTQAAYEWLLQPPSAWATRNRDGAPRCCP